MVSCNLEKGWIKQVRDTEVLWIKCFQIGWLNVNSLALGNGADMSWSGHDTSHIGQQYINCTSLIITFII